MNLSDLGIGIPNNKTLLLKPSAQQNQMVWQYPGRLKREREREQKKSQRMRSGSGSDGQSIRLRCANGRQS